jgi:hypothetical protein
MRALDDILFGFVVFFAIERSIRLFSASVVEPWARKKGRTEHVVENWKLGAELAALILVAVIVYRFRAIVRRFNSR